MKIRSDFVSNSSSTSFILIASDGWSKERLGQLMGVDKDSPLWPLVSSLFYTIEQNGSDIGAHYGVTSIEGMEAAVEKDFAKETASRIRAAVESGAKILVGRLGSDGPSTEAFLCQDSFEIEGDELYLNGLNCSW